MSHAFVASYGAFCPCTKCAGSFSSQRRKTIDQLWCQMSRAFFFKQNPSISVFIWTSLMSSAHWTSYALGWLASLSLMESDGFFMCTCSCTTVNVQCIPVQCMQCWIVPSFLQLQMTLCNDITFFFKKKTNLLRRVVAVVECTYYC